MCRRLIALIATLLLAATTFAQTTAPLSFLWGNPEDEVITQPITLTEGVYAVFHTTDGDFIVKLFRDKAPKTVENFIGLATGQKEWTHPITQVTSSKPLYNNTHIYRIVKDVEIDGGDPTNKGYGGPGYTLDLEISPDLKFDSAGLLAMANSGRNKSNGSRWFITLVPLPDFTGRYTIFGRVIGGLNVVRQISRKPTRRPLEPLEPTVVNTIDIIEIPPKHQTVATFSTEKGVTVITVEKEFKGPEEESEETSPTTTQDKATSPSAAK
ncbi:MAG: peptidylprolyl isomerase [Candidatus Sumerlaeaceae bacterium]|nr:peptidylprolyl isomerase [Candidatus Sumerlaeaceae bacterium]